MAWEYKRIQVFDAVCNSVQLRAVDCIGRSCRDTTCSNVLDLTFFTCRTYRQYCAVAQTTGCACEAAVSVVTNSSSIGRYEVAGCRTVTQGYAVFDSRFSFCTQSQSVLGCCLSVVTQGSCKLAVSLRETAQCDGLFWSGLALYAQSYWVFTSCLSSRTKCRSRSTIGYRATTDCYVRTLFGLSVTTQCYCAVCQSLRTLTDGSCDDTGCLRVGTNRHCRTGIIHYAVTIRTSWSTIGLRVVTYSNVSSFVCSCAVTLSDRVVADSFRLSTQSDRVVTDCFSSSTCFFTQSTIRRTTNSHRVSTYCLSRCTTGKWAFAICLRQYADSGSTVSSWFSISTDTNCVIASRNRFSTDSNGVIVRRSSSLTHGNRVRLSSSSVRTYSNCSFFIGLRIWTNCNCQITFCFCIWTNADSLNTWRICASTCCNRVVLFCYAIFTDSNRIGPSAMSVITNRDRILMWSICMRTHCNSRSTCMRIITDSGCKLCVSSCTVTVCTCGVLSSSRTVTYCSRTNLSCLGYVTNCNRSFTTCNRAYTDCSWSTFGCLVVVTYSQCRVCGRSIISTDRSCTPLIISCVLIAYNNRVLANVVTSVISAIWRNINCRISKIHSSLSSAWSHQGTCRCNCSSYGFTLIGSGFFAVCMADFGNRGPCLGRVVPNDFKDFIHIDFPVRGLISFGTFARL